LPGKPTRLLVLGILFLALAALAGCGLAVLSKPVSPRTGDQNMVGLALAEEVYLNLKRQATVKLVPASGSDSFYLGEIKPGGKKFIFERLKASELYLAWVPAGFFTAGKEKPAIVLTGHEIKSRAGVFRTTWPADQAPVISGRFQPGRVTYLGLVKRRMYLADLQKDEPGLDKKSAFSRLELIYSPDQEATGLIPALYNNPWLRELILDSPPGLKKLIGEKTKP